MWSGAYPPGMTTPSKSAKRLNVVPGLEEIRPYVAACTSTGYRVTQEGLAQLIQTQEKLAEMFGVCADTIRSYCRKKK